LLKFTYNGKIKNLFNHLLRLNFLDLVFNANNLLVSVKMMTNNFFAVQVTIVLEEIRDLLIAKNQKYGNSALEPLGVFSQLSAKEGLLVRIDDKLKRIKNGSLERDDEDVINDLIGYLVLLKING
jgi:hypothetical protein